MTSKHFKAIASDIHAAYLLAETEEAKTVLRVAANNMAHTFKGTNSRFDINRFMLAALGEY